MRNNHQAKQEGVGVCTLPARAIGGRNQRPGGQGWS